MNPLKRAAVDGVTDDSQQLPIKRLHSQAVNAVVIGQDLQMIDTSDARQMMRPQHTSNSEQSSKNNLINNRRVMKRKRKRDNYPAIPANTKALVGGVR